MKTCLIIDDVKVSRFTSKLHLEELGLQTCEAPNETAAMDILNKGNVDFIFLDWHLEQTSGIDFLKQLRESEKFKGLPVVMFSGVEGEESSQKAIQAGANAFLAKPTTKEKIEQQLKKIGAL